MEDLDSNPEVNSFRFMQFIIESLFLLDKLPHGKFSLEYLAIQTILDRAPLEVFNVVEREISDAGQK